MPRVSARHVRGTLFVDYVRMLRSRKDFDWSKQLQPQDIAYLGQRIALEEWYPMESFERMGLAILAEIAGGDIASVKEWGRSSIDGLRLTHPDLVTPGDARESLMKFSVLRSGFFDFPALVVNEINDGEASVQIAYQMGALAEEAASNQTMGFFERLLELAGVREPRVYFASRSWTGAAVTVLEMGWDG
jgi:hypothetical protein